MGEEEQVRSAQLEELKRLSEELRKVEKLIDTLPTCSRAYSIAKTQLETGLLWLEKAIREDEDKLMGSLYGHPPKEKEA